MTFPVGPDPHGDDDGLVPPTLYEPPGGTGGMAAPDPRGEPVELPPSLTGRFQPRERLPRRGEQTVHRAAEEGRSAELRAAVFRVRCPADGTERIVKWFHPDAAPDPAVTALLSRGQLHAGLSYVLEAGVDRGAPFHVLPSHGNTDLATHLRDHSGPLPTPDVERIVERLHGALTALHAAGVVHRDLKPSNLVLGDYDDPATMVLIDFGISATGPFPRQVGRGWAGTPGYASPQAQLMASIVRPADDWWSLGIVVAEAALGRHPVRHRETASVMDAVQRGDIDLDGIRDPRVRLLCEGLLTWDHEHRWGAGQVRRWLDHESPDVVREGPRPRPGGRPAADPEAPHFEHAGRRFTDPAELGEVFDADWPAMARRLSRGRGREQLADWLAEFRPTADTDRAGELDELLDRLRRARRGPDAATLIDLIGWMAPQQEPGYRGIPLGMGDLPAFAGRAADGDRQCVSVMNELYGQRLLTRLARRRGGEELTYVSRRWHTHHRQWAEATARLSQIPELRDHRDDLRAATATGPALTAELLRLAADPAPVTRRLRAELRDVLRALPARVPWFTRLAEAADDPVPLLLTLRLRPLAEAQARETRRAQEERRQLAAIGRRAEHTRLVRRRLELPVVLGRAAGGALLLFFPHAFLVGLADVYGWAPQSTVLIAWMLSVPSLAALLVIECWTAWYIGPWYHPRFSVMGLMTRRALPLTSRIGRRGWKRYLWAAVGAAALAGTVAGTFFLAVWIWPAGTVLALLVSAVLRVRAWHRYQADARSGSLSAPPADPRSEPRGDARGGRRGDPPAGPRGGTPGGPHAGPHADPRGGVPGARRPTGSPAPTPASPSFSPSGHPSGPPSGSSPSGSSPSGPLPGSRTGGVA
ncbi:protein kinase [Streptomyces sp. NPDC000345]|uniref:protein kinase domain-containing protein n=1 Tax=Streptomyces sp. NPDC000345 TaxID=3364537 RepID=UPI0036A3A061